MAPRRNTKTTRMITSIICILLTIPLFVTQYAEARIPKEQIKNFQHFSHRGHNIKTTDKKVKQFNHLGLESDPPLDLPNSKSYGVSSPFSLPPFDSPTSPNETTPPDCEDSPSTAPPPPSTSTSTPTPINTPSTPTVNTPFPPSPSSPYILTPIFPIQSPPQIPSENPYQSPPFSDPNPPENSPLTPSTPDSPYFVPTPTQSPPFSNLNPPENSPITPSTPDYVPSPTAYVPTPPEYVPSPPDIIRSPTGYVPGPPDYEPSPTVYVPSPDVGYVPSPSMNVPSPIGYGVTPGLPVFQPPVLFPPPTGPPSPYKGPQRALWCVVKPSVPDPIIEEAMNYACGSGADCGSIQPQGSCYHPETLFAHASFAFNSYWQRTKVAGGTCDFGGTAILVTIDPSFNGCHFIAT